MALGGGGSRKRKAARRAKAHESEIMESVAASLGKLSDFFKHSK